MLSPLSHDALSNQRWPQIKLSLGDSNDIAPEVGGEGLRSEGGGGEEYNLSI